MPMARKIHQRLAPSYNITPPTTKHPPIGHQSQFRASNHAAKPSANDPPRKIQPRTIRMVLPRPSSMLHAWFIRFHCSVAAARSPVPAGQLLDPAPVPTPSPPSPLRHGCRNPDGAGAGHREGMDAEISRSFGTGLYDRSHASGLAAPRLAHPQPPLLPTPNSELLIPAATAAVLLSRAAPPSPVS